MTEVGRRNPPLSFIRFPQREIVLNILNVDKYNTPSLPLFIRRGLAEEYLLLKCEKKASEVQGRTNSDWFNVASKNVVRVSAVENRRTALRGGNAVAAWWIISITFFFFSY